MAGVPSARKKQRILSEVEKKILKEAFELFDANNDGYLDYYEFKASSRCLGFHLKKSEILVILETYARNNKNLICYEDFYEVKDRVVYLGNPRGRDKNLHGSVFHHRSITSVSNSGETKTDIVNTIFRILVVGKTKTFRKPVEEKMVKRDPMYEIKEAFKLIANEKTNAITFRDLKYAAEKVGADIPDRDLRSMIEEFDTKGEGKLDEEDFTNLITGEAL